MENEPLTKTNEDGGFRSGFVAIIGAPNTGKSTLLNQLLGQKVAITTPKPQTTRQQIKGILTGENFQIVFVDTPGIHESKHLLNQVIVDWATKALADVDAVIFVVDITRRRPATELAILDLLKHTGKPVILALNKIDLVAKETLLPIIDEMRDFFPFEAIMPISAIHNEGLDLLIDETMRLMPEGPQYYDTTYLTDQTKEMFVAELIREKIFIMAEEEVPYSTFVEVEPFNLTNTTKAIPIHATIYVEKPSQKGIIIGKEARFIKKVKRLVLEELKQKWPNRIELDLWIKVLKNWSKDQKYLKRIGLIE